VGGECAPGATADCPPGQLLCSGACRDVFPNFGTEGISCPGGAPPTICPTSQVLCNGACFPEGACQPTDCAPGWGYCYGVCRDFQSDPGYCGACGTACPGGICSGGACVECAAGMTACGAACVDTATDLDNCGFCGNRCGTQCLNGQCAGVGPSPTEVEQCARSGEFCVTDGSCCSGGLCIYGKCYVPGETCPYGMSRCVSTAGSFCAATNDDPNFCGDCYTRCAVGDVCQNADCVTPSTASSNDLAAQPIVVAEEPAAAPEELPAFSCPEGQVDCGGICVDVSFDPLNCGACGVACGPDVLCDFGVCGSAPEPEVEATTCLAAGDACDTASPGACCSGVCNEDGACA
jgi:hypothetical protein